MIFCILLNNFPLNLAAAGNSGARGWGRPCHLKAGRAIPPLGLPACQYVTHVWPPSSPGRPWQWGPGSAQQRQRPRQGRQQPGCPPPQQPRGRSAGLACGAPAGAWPCKLTDHCIVILFALTTSGGGPQASKHRGPHPVKVVAVRACMLRRTKRGRGRDSDLWRWEAVKQSAPEMSRRIGWAGDTGRCPTWRARRSPIHTYTPHTSRHYQLSEDLRWEPNNSSLAEVTVPLWRPHLQPPPSDLTSSC